MHQESPSYLRSVLQSRMVQVIIGVVSIFLLGWVALAYMIAALLSTQNGNDRQLVTTALVGAGVLVAALILWRRGVPIVWILGVGGLAALIQLLILFL